MAPPPPVAVAFPLLILFAVASSVQGGRSISSSLECEDLSAEVCAFAVASSGARCVLEKHINKNARVQYVCQTSLIMAESGVADWIESDACIQACGLKRLSVGFSTDELLEYKFIKAICLPGCKNNCPNIMDLYTKLAAEEGVYFPHLCDSIEDIGKYVEIKVSPKVESLNEKKFAKETDHHLLRIATLPSLDATTPPSLESTIIVHTTNPVAARYLVADTQHLMPTSPEYYTIEFPNSPVLAPTPHDYEIEPPRSAPPSTTYGQNMQPPYQSQPPTYDKNVEPPFASQSPMHDYLEPPYVSNPPMYDYVEPPYVTNPPMYGYAGPPHLSNPPMYDYVEPPRVSNPPTYDYVEPPYLPPPPLGDYNIEPSVAPQSPTYDYNGQPPTYDYNGQPPTSDYNGQLPTYDYSGHLPTYLEFPSPTYSQPEPTLQAPNLPPFSTMEAPYLSPFYINA